MDIKAGTIGTGAGREMAPRAQSRRADAGAVLLALALLGWGWRHRGDAALYPHAWPGYLLGLGGSVMMALVLGFSWRKRVPGGRTSVAAWYELHCLFGLFGAVAVLIHARFAWGSINSSFATVATGLVVLSGVVARYALGPARRSGHRWGSGLVEAWHFLHVPLYGVLVIAVIVHIYMAHAY